MPRHSTPCHLTSTTVVRRQSSSFPVLRLLPASSSIHISPLPRHRSSTSRPLSTMPHLPPPPPSRSSLVKQPRKPSRNKTSSTPSSISRSAHTSRPQSPALLQEQASHSDAHRPTAKKPRATHRFKTRPRAHSLSLACSPVRPSLEALDAKPTLPPSRRPRTVTLNEQLMNLKPEPVPSRPKSFRRGPPFDLLEGSTSKSDARSKRTLKKRSGRTRAERRRVSTSSSDEAELSLGVEALDEPSPTSEVLPRRSISPRILKPISTSPTTPSFALTTSSAQALPNAVHSPHGLVQSKLPSSARPVALRAGAEGKPNQHYRTKSAASILNSSTPVTIIPINNLRSKTVQDDWDMPPNAFGPGFGLTWQQKKKPKPKSTSAIDSTLSVAALSTSSNLSKKMTQADSSATSISPLFRSTSLHTKTVRRGRAPLARTPSAGNVIQSVSSGLGHRPKSPMVPSDSEPFDGSQSLPPSPTPARFAFASSYCAIESQKSKIDPLSIVGSDTSLTWQQAIMRSSPPKNAFQVSSNHVDKNANDSSKLVSAKRILVPSSLNPAFTTPVKSASSLPRSAPLISTSTKKLVHRSSTPLPLLGTLDPHESKEPSTFPSFQTDLCNLIMPPRPITTSSKSSPIGGLTNKYAGPQFHNSPAPTTLPAPKFSFGS